MFQPKLVSSLKGYNLSLFTKDLVAGIIVGIVALPLSIAFGIASGVSPEKGIITAFIAGFIISALGGSRVQIGGPTGAFIIIVYGVIHDYGVAGLTIATIMAGVLLILMGVLKLGIAIKFIPYPVVIGFTSGIAVVIFFSQIKDALGLPVEALPADFIEKLFVYARHVGSTQPAALAVAAASVAVIAAGNRFMRKVPAALAAILLATAAVQLFDIPIETIGSRFGEIRAHVAVLDIEMPTYQMLRDLMQPAFVIAILGAIESLLSATVADGMIGGSHRSNMELIAQGAANIVAPIFGGIPATGAIARTATNIKNGGRTPVAGIVHAIVLLLIFFFFIPYASMIPMACLAGILIVVAYNMSEWRSFVAFSKGPKSDMIVMVATFFHTVVFDLTIAIEIGLLLSLLLLLRRLSTTSSIKKSIEAYDKEVDDDGKSATLSLPEKVEVYEIDGPFFFGIAHKFEEATRVIQAEKPRVRILRLRKAPFVDATGLHHLEQMFEKCRANDIQLVLSGINPQPREALIKSGLYRKLGAKNICKDIGAAIRRSADLAREMRPASSGTTPQKPADAT